MPSYRKGKWVRTPYDVPFRLGYDDRKGLGYGVLEPTSFNDTRQRQGNFPYIDPDPYANESEQDEMTDEEMDAFITKINQGYVPSDFFSAAGKDRFYFFAGNTPMHEIAMHNDNINSDPPAYQGRKHGPMLRTGAAFPYPGGGGTNYKRTGTVSGFSHPPPPLAVDPELGEYLVNDLRDMPPKDERTLYKLRVLIADIIKQQEEAQE